MNPSRPVSGLSGEHLAAPDVLPDLGQLVGGVDRLLAGRDEGAVDGARGGGDEQVGRDASLIERAQHPDLDRAESGTAGEDEGDG